MRKAFLFVLLACSALPALGQSVADAVRKAKQEREGRKPVRVLTSAQLPVQTPAPAEPAQTGEEAKVELQGGDKAKKDPQEEVNGRFKARIVQKLREIQDLKRQKDVAQLDFNDLRNKYFSASDGIFRDNVLRQQRDKAFQRIDDLRGALEKSTTELGQLLEEARKNGVPPGVVREAQDEGQSQPQPPGYEAGPEEGRVEEADKGAP